MKSGRSSHRLVEFAALESRRLMCVDHGFADPAGALVGTSPAASSAVVAATGTTSTSTTTVAAAGVPLSSVPNLHSNPNASAKLYLDFDGEAAQSWGGYSVTATPAYDQDGDAATFSSGELTSIQQIWARVAEKYSPFNIDVTTQNPGNLTDRATSKVVFGGDGAWIGGGGGVAYVGGFYNSAPNTAWVFTKQLANGDPKYSAEAGAHESGHTFGLQHQATWSGTTKTNEYNPGTGATSPVMGNSYSATRGLWWYGTSAVSSTSVQDDMAVIANSSNAFGYRADDHGNSVSAATPLTLSGTSVSGSGVITTTGDSDYFSFASGAGQITLAANPVTGGMLDAKLAVYSDTGTLLGSSDAGLGESLTLSVGGGNYRVAVSSHGGYGDVGQYTVSGTVVAVTTEPPPVVVTVTAPSGLTAAGQSPTQVVLSWADNSTNEDGFVVQRSTDGGATWSNLTTTAANVTTFGDAGAAAGSTYAYRVLAFSGTTNSAYSNVAAATTVTLAPNGLTAAAASASQINLAWSDVAGETGYKVERSSDGGATWVQVGTTGANVTTFASTGLAAGTAYAYRVRAANGGGDSAYSATAAATTQQPPAVVTVPAAPSGLTATAPASNRVNLTWADNSSNETGFKVERFNGKSWSQVATVGAGATAYTDTTVAKRKTYSYRVRATNSAGDSGYSNTVSVTTPAFTTNAGNVASARSAGVFSAVAVKGSVLDELLD